MRLSQGKVVVSLMLVTLFCGSTIPAFASTDDDGKGEPPAKRPAAKVDAPAPLTERERWLLDRVEQLEKRVADLESKDNSSPSPAANPSAAQLSSTIPAASDAAVATPSVNAGAPPANSDSHSNDRVAAVEPQATEKGKSGAAQAGKAEPFSFADFTWLNGNART